MIGWSTFPRPDSRVKQLLMLVMLAVVTSSSSNALDMKSSLGLARGRVFPNATRRVGRFATEEEMKPANARRLSGQYLCRWNQDICEQEPISFLLGPDCCNSACTNVQTDLFNCGSCGRICFYGSVCCGGSCVDVFNDVQHCGSCLNSCASGASCQFGICGYP